MNTMMKMSVAFTAIDDAENDSAAILGLYGVQANGPRVETPAWSSLSRRRNRKRRRANDSK